MEIEMKKRLKKVYQVLEGCRDELEEIRDEIQEVYDDLSSDEQDEEEGEELLEEIGNMESGTSDIDDVLGMLDEYTLDVPYEEESSENVKTFSMDIDTQSSNKSTDKIKAAGSTRAEKAKQLKKNIEIITSSFDMYNMQLLGWGCKADEDDTRELDVFAEVVVNESLKDTVYVKVNLYDEDDDILETDYGILPKKFCGLQTLRMRIYNKTIFDRAVKGRIYAAKA